MTNAIILAHMSGRVSTAPESCNSMYIYGSDVDGFIYFTDNARGLISVADFILYEKIQKAHH